MGIDRIFGLYRRLLSVLFAVLAVALTQHALATDYGAVSSGAWSNAATWTSAGGPGVPGASDYVYIGSNYPAGAAATATATLSQNQSAAYVYLGYGNGSGGNGALNLSNYNLNVGGYVYLGSNVGTTGSITRGSGSITTPTLYVDNQNSFTFGSADAVNTLNVYDGAKATTAGTGNVATNVTVASGGTITLGPDMAITGTFNVQDAGSTLNMGGHRLSANEIELGYASAGATTLVNRGPVTAPYLYVANQPFSLSASDSATNYYIFNVTGTLGGNSVSNLQQSNSSSLTTTGTANLSGNINLYSGSTLTFGGSMTVGGYLDVRAELHAEHGGLSTRRQRALSRMGQRRAAIHTA